MKKAIRVLAVVLCLCSIVGVFAACGNSGGGSGDSSSAGGAKKFKIAYVGPLTGDYSQYGVSMQAGLDLAIERWKADGGLEGYELEVLYYDDKNDAKESVIVTNNAIGEDVMAVLGPFASTCAMAMSPLLMKAEIIHYAISCSHPDVTKAGEWVFRGVNMNDMEAYPPIDLAIKQGTKKIGILYLNNDWGTAVYEFAAKRIAEQGAELVASANFIDGQTRDFTPMISNIKEGNADAVFLVCFYNDAASIIQQLRQLDFEGDIYVPQAVTNDAFIPLVGDAGEGVYAIALFTLDNPNPIFQDFVKKYQEKNPGREIDFSCIIGYDCAASLLHCVNQVGEPDKYKVREALAGLRNYEGCNGTWSFDENRDPKKPVYYLKLEGGQWTTFGTYDVSGL